MAVKGWPTGTGNWVYNADARAYNNRDITSEDIELIKKNMVFSGFCPAFDGVTEESAGVDTAYSVIKISELSDSLKNYLVNRYTGVPDILVVFHDAQFGWKAFIGYSDNLQEYLNMGSFNVGLDGKGDKGHSKIDVTNILDVDYRFFRDLEDYAQIKNEECYKKCLYDGYKFICAEGDFWGTKNTMYRISTPFLYRTPEGERPVILDVLFEQKRYDENLLDGFVIRGFHINHCASVKADYAENPDGTLEKIEMYSLTNFYFKGNPYNEVQGVGDYEKAKAITLSVSQKGQYSYYTEDAFRLFANAEAFVTCAMDDFGVGYMPRAAEVLDSRHNNPGPLGVFDNTDLTGHSL